MYKKFIEGRLGPTIGAKGPGSACGELELVDVLAVATLELGLVKAGEVKCTWTLVMNSEAQLDPPSPPRALGNKHLVFV